MEIHNQIMLIFMDIHMPVMDGIECTKQLRQMNINIPIIALTANSMLGEEEKYTAIGMNAFILKPIQIKLLEEYILKYKNMQ